MNQGSSMQIESRTVVLTFAFGEAVVVGYRLDPETKERVVRLKPEKQAGFDVSERYFSKLPTVIEAEASSLI